MSHQTPIGPSRLCPIPSIGRGIAAACGPQIDDPSGNSAFHRGTCALSCRPSAHLWQNIGRAKRRTLLAHPTLEARTRAPGIRVQCWAALVGVGFETSACPRLAILAASPNCHQGSAKKNQNIRNNCPRKDTYTIPILGPKIQWRGSSLPRAFAASHRVDRVNRSLSQSGKGTG